MNDRVRNKSDEAAIDAGCYFDMKAADRVRYFFSRFLRHSKGAFADKKFELLDWQWDRVIAPLFGWMMPDGTRRFRRAGIAVPKKNGKSTLLSGIGLYMLCGDGEPGAEVYSCAASKDQAGIIYTEAANMVESSPALASIVALKRHAKEMQYGQCPYKALSADVPTKDGLNIHCLLFDELHTQATSALWDTLRYGFAARRQPLLLWITTAGIYNPASICYKQWQHAKLVQESVQTDISFLPCVYETQENDDWTSEATFAKCNPSYKITISERDFQESVKEAIDLPSNENNYRRLRLNQWTKQETRWIPFHLWEKCASEDTIGPRPSVIVGLDLATTTDLAAATVACLAGDDVILRSFFWLPSEALTRRRKENAALLDSWCPKFIKLTPGHAIDFNVIRRDLNDLADEFKISEIAIDPWNAHQIANDLVGDGFKVVYVRTGFISISAATKEFQRRVLAGTIKHASNPVFDWMMCNIAVEEDASGNLKPSKRRSSEKIDGPVSAIIALARLIGTKQKRRSTAYDDKGAEFL